MCLKVTDVTDREIVLADGSRAGFAIYGDPGGRPVLALHGAPACRLMFAMCDATARRLGLKIIAPDRPGYGLSPSDARLPATLEHRAAWLADFATAVRLDRFVILAISGGGPYAMAVAARLGARVQGVALVSPMGPAADYDASPEAVQAPISRTHRMFFLRISQMPAVVRPAAWLFSVAVRVVPSVLFGAGSFLAGDADAGILRRPAVRNVLLGMTREAFRQGGHGAADDLAIYGRPWPFQVEDVTAPVVLWQGTADRIVPVAANLHLASRLPNCRLIRLDGAGHFWVLGAVDSVLAEAAAMFV